MSAEAVTRKRGRPRKTPAEKADDAPSTAVTRKKAAAAKKPLDIDDNQADPTKEPPRAASSGRNRASKKTKASDSAETQGAGQEQSSSAEKATRANSSQDSTAASAAGSSSSSASSTSSQILTEIEKRWKAKDEKVRNQESSPAAELSDHQPEIPTDEATSSKDRDQKGSRPDLEFPESEQKPEGVSNRRIAPAAESATAAPSKIIEALAVETASNPVVSAPTPEIKASSVLSSSMANQQPQVSSSASTAGASSQSGPSSQKPKVLSPQEIKELGSRRTPPPRPKDIRQTPEYKAAARR